MINLAIEKADVNAAKLDADLKSALGAAFIGLSHDGRLVTVHLADKATLQQQAEAERIVETHDAAALTPAQQAERDRDALPLFTLTPDEAATWAGRQDAATFQRAMARAFAHLRDLLRGG